MNDAIREAFEKWWLIEMGHRIHDQRSGDGYFPSDADASWEAWQAVLQSSQTAPAVPGCAEAENLCDLLYRAGYVTREKERDYDPRGHEAWQACYDAMLPASAPASRSNQ